MNLDQAQMRRMTLWLDIHEGHKKGTYSNNGLKHRQLLSELKKIDDYIYDIQLEECVSYTKNSGNMPPLEMLPNKYSKLEWEEMKSFGVKK